MPAAKTPVIQPCAKAALTSVRKKITTRLKSRPVSIRSPCALSLWRDRMRVGGPPIKIEARHPTPAYVAQVTKVWREAIDNCRENPHRYSAKQSWMNDLDKVAEGQQHTLGAYYRPWK